MTPKRPTPSPFRARTAAAAFVCIVAVVLAGTAANAEDEEYANYFEFQAGLSHIPNQTIDPGGAGIGLGSVQTQEAGFHIGGALGRRITDLVRGEIAVTYRETDIDQAGLTSGAQADGDLSLLAFMANGYVDFDLGPVKPWIGAGIGGGIYKIDVQQKVPGAFDIDDGDPVFVYNAMAGVALPVTEVFTLNVGYRYIAIAGETGSGAIIAPATTTQQVDDEFDAHEVVIGLRFGF